MTLIEARRSTEEIHEAYRVVKRGIESEYRTRDLARTLQNAASKRWLSRPFQEAFVHLSAPVNGQPDKIYESVYEAASDLSNEISDIRGEGDADAT